jgi:hypothetical protein
MTARRLHPNGVAKARVMNFRAGFTTDRYKPHNLAARNRRGSGQTTACGSRGQQPTLHSILLRCFSGTAPGRSLPSHEPDRLPAPLDLWFSIHSFWIPSTTPRHVLACSFQFNSPGNGSLDRERTLNGEERCQPRNQIGFRALKPTNTQEAVRKCTHYSHTSLTHKRQAFSTSRQDPSHPSGSGSATA